MGRQNHKTIWLCAGVTAILLLCMPFFSLLAADTSAPSAVPPDYEGKLFDPSYVHTVDIVIDDWQELLDTAAEEVYRPCTVTIDGEAFSQVAIRPKGNNSLRLTEAYGWDRYSLKLSFDKYIPQTYHGLEKLSLDSSFQDNSYMKTWLTFDMMRSMGVPTPLCSYTKVTVNGEYWGLFLAIEEPEKAFAVRNFGADHGQLYKPDYRSLQAENADVALRYVDEDFASYDNIFRTARFPLTGADKQRVVDTLRILSSGEDLTQAVDVDAVLRYFTVQVFVVNLDGYLGKNGHNYLLYEKDGRLSMLPWDYNLAFGTYSLGMPDPINDATLYVNYPIYTPASGEIMTKRPLYHHLMKNNQIFAAYRAHFDTFLADYFESGYFAGFVEDTREMIAPFVETDPTAFCSYADFQLGVDTIREFCLLRAQSARGQLEGTIPATIRAQSEDPTRVDASHIRLPDMGEVADLKRE